MQKDIFLNMKPEKRKSLEQSLPEGQLVNRAWLKKNGFNRYRVDYFLRAGKLEALSQGIYRRPGPPLKWEHVVYSLVEMGFPVHAGGKSALELQGFAHYLPLGETQVINLYSMKNIPAWTFQVSGPFRFEKTARKLFNVIPETALTSTTFGAWDWKIPISTPELALVEFLASLKTSADFSIGDKFFEAALNLRPKIIQDVLVNCKQVKAKRLFLWFSDRHNHSWHRILDIRDVDIGRGKRMLVKGGAYDAAYQITIPKPMVKNDANGL